MRNKAIIAVDTQIDFVMNWGLLSVPHAEEIISPGIRYLADLEAEEIRAVIFTGDAHVSKEYAGSLENVGNPETGEPGFPLHCEAGTPGAQNVFNPGIVPDGIAVHSLSKTVFDMWQETSEEVRIASADPMGGEVARDAFFAMLGSEGVDTLVIFGVASDFCVKYAIKGALDRGFKVEVEDQLCRGIIRDMATVLEEDFSGMDVILV